VISKANDFKVFILKGIVSSRDGAGIDGARGVNFSVNRQRKGFPDGAEFWKQIASD
jgi:hypothetical protein